MKNLLTFGLLTSLLLGSLSYAGERELTRCRRVIGDEKAHDVFSTIMPGRPSEMLTVCGSYGGGAGKGGEAGGLLFNWHFIRSYSVYPDKVLKVYIHRVSSDPIQLDGGRLIRFAYGGQSIGIKDVLAFTNSVTTKSVVISYIDEQNALREKELSESDVSL